MGKITTLFGIFILTLLGTMGAFFLKRTSGTQIKLHLFQIFKCPFLYLAGVCYITAALLNIILLKYMDYSILYPMTSLTYVWTAILAHLKLKEKINYKKIIAILLIVAGVFVLNMPQLS